jgi:tetratricopeptide (TPR) repeat protein
MRQTSAGEVELSSGALCGRRHGSSLVVSTRHVTAVFVDAAFLVETTAAETVVTVYEGSGTVRRLGGDAIRVAAGHSVRSGDLPAQAPEASTEVARLASLVSPGLAAGQSTACGHAGSVGEHRKCLERLARGNGLGGENALFTLGLLDRDELRDGNAAIGDWRAYLARFEEGVFAPEARLALIAELVAQARDVEALEECDVFHVRFAADPRSGDVALIRGLLNARRGRPERALEDFARAGAVTSSPSAREEALFQTGLWSEQLGRSDAARRAWRELVSQFPGGARATEVTGRLADLEAFP